MTAKTNTKPPREEVHDESELDEALRESFPASDPPAYATPHHNEPPPGRASEHQHPPASTTREKDGPAEAGPK